LGTFAASSGGGGAAEASGVDALFVNPAAMEIPGGLQVELGMMRLSNGLSPYGAFAAQGTASSRYGLAYFYDKPAESDTGSPGPALQGLIAGGAWTIAQGGPGDLLRSLAVGVTAHTYGTEAAFGVDADMGARARLLDHLAAGAAVREFFESGVGTKPGGYETLRSYLLSAGLEQRYFKLWKFRIRDPGAYYEVRAAGFPPDGFVHAFTAKASFIQQGVMGLRAAVLLPHEGTMYYAGGFDLRLPLGAGLLICGYGFASGSGGVDDSPSHSFSLNFSALDRGDRLAPRVTIAADRLRMNPLGGESEWVHFRVTAADRIPKDEENPSPEMGDEIGRLREWMLTIRALGQGGRPLGNVRVFQGRDLPPRLIRWDGRNDSGAVLSSGYYAFRLSAEDASGNQGMTAWQMLEIAAPAAPVTPATEEKRSPADSLDLGGAEPGVKQ
jgi:hypothetical protein